MLFDDNREARKLTLSVLPSHKQDNVGSGCYLEKEWRHTCKEPSNPTGKNNQCNGLNSTRIISLGGGLGHCQ